MLAEVIEPLEEVARVLARWGICRWL